MTRIDMLILIIITAAGVLSELYWSGWIDGLLVASAAVAATTWVTRKIFRNGEPTRTGPSLTSEKEVSESNEINVTLFGRQKSIRGWPATLLIHLILILAVVGAVKVISAII